MIDLKLRRELVAALSLMCAQRGTCGCRSCLEANGQAEAVLAKAREVKS